MDEEVTQEKETMWSSQTHFAKELTANEEAEGDSQMLTAEQKREILKMFTEEPEFSNKRKKELKRLLETPVFTETRIRFKLPDGSLIESYFSPVEKVKHLREELEKVV